MAFIPLDGLTGKLTGTFASADTSFLANAAFVSDLESALASDGDYTYLSVIGRNGGYEIVKVSNVAGDLTVDRGQGSTVAINAIPGSCVRFESNTVVLAEMIANGGIEPPVCELIAGEGITITPDGCRHTISVEWPTCDDQTFMGATFAVENGCLTVTEPDSCNCDPVDGTYENATVTVRNGRICAIQTGANPQYLAPSCTCCGCSNETE